MCIIFLENMENYILSCCFIAIFFEEYWGETSYEYWGQEHFKDYSQLLNCKYIHSCRLYSLPADVLWGSFVTHSLTPKDVCGEAIVCTAIFSSFHLIPLFYQGEPNRLGAFYRLSSVRLFLSDLFGNPIEKIERDAFNGLQELRTL